MFAVIMAADMPNPPAEPRLMSKTSFEYLSQQSFGVDWDRLCARPACNTVIENADGDTSGSASDPDFSALPIDVLLCIFAFLPPRDVVMSCSRVSQSWRQAAKLYSPATPVSIWCNSADMLQAVPELWPRMTAIKYVAIPQAYSYIGVRFSLSCGFRMLAPSRSLARRGRMRASCVHAVA